MRIVQDLVFKFINWFVKTRLHLAYAMLSRGNLEYRIMRINQFNLSIAKMHDKTFSPFKNKFAGREVAIIACGPSLNEYEPISDTINIGVNRSFKHTKISLDYLFVQDALGCSREDMREFNSYRPDECVKFYGIACERLHNSFAPWIVSESDAIMANALRYRTCHTELAMGLEQVYPFDISTQPLAEFGSVVFSAIQFALWGNPKRIYLVGCDCATNGYFYEKKSHNCIGPMVATGYAFLKPFAAAYYPDTEIVSVNPVGLKGMFRDIYQKKEA